MRRVVLLVSCSIAVWLGSACGRVSYDARCPPPSDGCTECPTSMCVPTAERCNGLDDDCDGTIDDGACPSDGTVTRFRGAPFLALTTPRTWADAKSTCGSVGLVLPHVRDAATWHFLWGLSAPETTWLGATDTQLEGTWRWDDDQSIFWERGFGGASPGPYVNFEATMEPNDTGSNEDCLVMWSPYEGKWADEACDRTYRTVCAPP